MKLYLLSYFKLIKDTVGDSKCKMKIMRCPGLKNSYQEKAATSIEAWCIDLF